MLSSKILYNSSTQNVMLVKLYTRSNTISAQAGLIATHTKLTCTIFTTYSRSNIIILIIYDSNNKQVPLLFQSSLIIIQKDVNYSSVSKCVTTLQVLIGMSPKQTGSHCMLNVCHVSVQASRVWIPKPINGIWHMSGWNESLSQRAVRVQQINWPPRKKNYKLLATSTF